MFAPFSGTLDELAALLDRAAAASEIFGHDAGGQYRRLARICHPDLFPAGPEQDKASKVFRRLTELYDGASMALRAVTSPSREYRLLKHLAAGDLADVQLAVADGEVCTLGVTRAYMTRHGAGPLPTWAPELDAQLSDPGNPTNAWQGTIRRGWLDLVLLRYAAEAAGGPLDGLVVNCLDDVANVPQHICMGYRCAQNAETTRLPAPSAPWLLAQERLTTLLEEADPICEPASAALVCDILAREVAPISITGTGPAWPNKNLRSLRFRRQERGQQSAPATVVSRQ